jgi:hypothetical protein
LMLDQSIHANAKLSDSILYLYPDDVVEYHKQVRKNGVAVPELDLTFYGMTEFRIIDPDGNRVWIGQIASAGAYPDQVSRQTRCRRARVSGRLLHALTLAVHLAHRRPKTGAGDPVRRRRHGQRGGGSTSLKKNDRSHGTL